MKRENGIFLFVLAVAVIATGAIHMKRGTTTGRGYYEVKPDDKKVSLDIRQRTLRLKEIDAFNIDDAAKAELRGKIHFSWPRTIGIWLAAFFTLAILSFLYKDNPFYKIAEHAFVGVSAAYWMTVGFWSTVVPNLLGKLFPRWTMMHLTPGLDIDNTVETLAATSWLSGLIDYEGADGDALSATVMQLMNVWYWIPLVLGVMLLWRLAPKGAWIARWPLAFILGATAGVRMTGFLESDFYKQIQSAIVPLWAPVYDPADGAMDFGKTFYATINNVLMVFGVLCGLVYFFFSFEHKGIVGKVSRLGIWVLMITFGAGFAYTVMGRVALLIGRCEFLLTDWLNVVR